MSAERQPIEEILEQDTSKRQQVKDVYEVLKPKAIIDGWGINLATPKEAILVLIKAAKKAESFSCLTLNLDHLVKIKASKSFKEAYQEARFVTADGAPIAKLARKQSADIVRTTGADLMVPLCAAAAKEGVPIYLFGTSALVLEKTATRLKEQSDGKLKIAGMVSPPQGFDADSAAADKAIEKIQQSGARLCFVLLGAPKQEIFAHRAVAKGSKCGFICVGAAADFIAGDQVRAPYFFQKVGLEWFWRLAHNPRRLGMRYFQCATLLARLKVTQMLQNKS